MTTHNHAHPEFLALMKSVCEMPEDDVRRAVLSEWLQDRNDPLGEYINLELQIQSVQNEIIKVDAEWKVFCEQNGIVPGVPSAREFTEHREWIQHKSTERYDLSGRVAALSRRCDDLMSAHWVSWVLGPVHLSRMRDNLNNRYIINSNRQRQITPESPARSADLAFSRGLLYLAVTRLVDWCGRTCDRCVGRGHLWSGNLGSREGPYTRDCQVCFGMGTVMPLGPLLARHPIQTKAMAILFHGPIETVGGQYAYHVTDDDRWEDCWRRESSSHVPRFLFVRLKKQHTRRERSATYNTPGEAADDLHKALLSWARDPTTLTQMARQLDRESRPPAPVGRPIDWTPTPRD